MLGYLMYRSGLVPQRMAMLGLIGGPMLILSFGFILFGVYENGSGPSVLLALPGDRLGSVAGYLRGVEGLQAKPDHPNRGHARAIRRSEHGHRVTKS